jgi:hypothetical protein
MSSGINDKEKNLGPRVEYRKGCPVCEHSDPELERELRVFAELLLDAYLEKVEKVRQSRLLDRIDSTP